METHSTRNAHPLAQRLIERYQADGERFPVIEIAAGSGRNTQALIDAGIPVVSTRDEDPYTQLPGGRETYGAALSTHGYLHGATAKLRAGFADLRRVLRSGAPIFVTLGSIDDPRFGFGLEMDERTFAPGDGPEKGIPHAFFDRDAILELLQGYTIESLENVDVTDIVGRWAHPEIESGLGPQGPNATDSRMRVLHWFVVARKA